LDVFEERNALTSRRFALSAELQRLDVSALSHDWIAWQLPDTGETIPTNPCSLGAATDPTATSNAGAS